MLRFFAFAAVLLTVAACTASYSKQDTGGVGLSSGILDRGKAVLIALPADGSYQGKPYPGSGVTVAQQAAVAFAKHAIKVDTAAPGASDKGALLEAARMGGFGYLVIPTIAHWEHRATEWSGLPSRTAVALSVLDAQSGEKIQSTQLEARSRIVSWTSTSPESLVPGMLQGYVSELYGLAHQ